MKKLFILTILGSLALSSCSDLDFEGSQAQQIKENAEDIFGIIDPNQDWSSAVSGTVSITADAPLYDIAKVQILTESPYLNENARVVCEADVTKGETVTLSYDVLNSYEYLIAACVDTKGHYFTTSFDIGTDKVSFRAPSAARTRATRADVTYPDAGNIKLEYNNSSPSYNAARTIRANAINAYGSEADKKWMNQKNLHYWINSGWEDERLWKASGNIGSGWALDNGTIYRNLSVSDEELDAEVAALRSVLGDLLGRNDGPQTGRQNNVKTLRTSKVVSLYNNHLTSDGKNPLTLIPIQMSSTEANLCHIYYYYYKPSEVPFGMSEADYVKSLPKFKAIQSWSVYSEANKKVNVGGYEFFKVREFLLPYYGDPGELAVTRETSSSFGATDGKLYRIRNGRQLNGQSYYMAYKNDKDEQKLKTYTDGTDVVFQLWKVFTAANGGKMLYNVGAKKFLILDGKYASMFSDKWDKVKDVFFDIDDNNHIWRKGKTTGLGTDLGNKDNYGVWTDKTEADGDNVKWYFEEYTGQSPISATESVEFEMTIPTTTAVSNIIPPGYRIGFMFRKIKHGNGATEADTYLEHNMNACGYGFGELNKQMNHLEGHYSSAMTKFDEGMQEDDPRIALFNANGKTYITMEDGSDCQFNDYIIEIGGYDKTVLTEAPVATEEKESGIETDYLYSEEELVPTGQPYMLCFEDRSIEADYDMNDVVLRCLRLKGNKVELSLLACGGNDDVYIRGISGTLDDGYNLEKKEVHEFFSAEYDSEGNRFVNTVRGVPKKSPRTGEYILPDGMTIPQFLGQIYIENKTTGETIRVPRVGEAPLAIILPYDFKYPSERTRITSAYSIFLNWARQASQYADWYNHIDEESKVYPVETVIE